jgi:hypothetical protein
MLPLSKIVFEEMKLRRDVIMTSRAKKGKDRFHKMESDRKPEVCKHWLNSNCKNGDTCEFLHQYCEDLMQLCTFYRSPEGCKNERVCKHFLFLSCF